jgi:hypothetical protein
METRNGGWEPLRNFASFVARNECLGSKVDMRKPRDEIDGQSEVNGNQAGDRGRGGKWVEVKQRVLAVC